MTGQTESTRAFFDAAAGGWSSRYDRDAAMTARLERFGAALGARLAPGAAILDFGCGSGDIARHLSRAGYRVEGCDLSPAMIAAATLADPGKTVNWTVLPAPDRLPYPEAAFDAVVASSVLEYVPDPAATLGMLARLLRPGGLLLATVPDPGHPLRRREARLRLAARLPGAEALLLRSRWREGGHYQRISVNRLPPGDWAGLLERAGLEAAGSSAPAGDPLLLLAGRKPPPGSVPPPPLPAEDIFGNTKKLRFILDALARFEFRTGRKPVVLDFGCGNGEAVAGHLIARGIDYTGVDFHPPSLEHARRRFGGERARFLEAVPEERRFDAILYADVLEHLPEPEPVLCRHAGLLAPGGVIIGSVPNGYGPCEIEKYLDRKLGLYRLARGLWRLGRRLSGRAPAVAPAIPYNGACGHVVFFTLSRLRRMIAGAGLRLTRWGHGGFLGADLTGSTIFHSARFVRFNVRIADHLPAWLVSTWYFELER